jgi:hypothetical protein
MLDWRDSDTYQAILDEGRMDWLRKCLLTLGPRLFGPPDETTVAVLQAIEDLPRLRRMAEQLLDLSSWEQLLAIR